MFILHSQQNPGDQRIALTRNNVLAEFYIHRPGAPDGFGDLHWARVISRVPSMAGAFLALADSDANVRSSACASLSRSGGERAFALLEGMLTDHDEIVRHNAAIALGELGGDQGWAIIERALVWRKGPSDQDAPSDTEISDTLALIGYTLEQCQQLDRRVRSLAESQ